MKITANRKDDLVKQKEAYQADRAARKARHDEQWNNWRTADYAARENIAGIIREKIGPVSIDLQIQALPHAWGGKSYQIHITSEENNVHGEDKALSWSWDAYLMSDGTVTKESSSWSGLQATTSAHLASLEETLRVLKLLNKMDWATILAEAAATVPDHDDYVTEPDPQYADKDVPNYDQLILEAEIEEGIGQRIAFLGQGSAFRGKSWYMILSETPKMYTVAEVGDYAIQDEWLNAAGRTIAETFDKNAKYPTKITKEKFLKLLDKPVQTMGV